MIMSKEVRCQVTDREVNIEKGIESSVDLSL
jgi:hypothetical protein